ncbi:MAG TPA: ABC transporter permease [Arsenicitalea sp.]|jgi:ABC-type dipeptide/oligopeptide/nickel transport system permease component|nr:ABC transporter permease [Arsenicitalea sp.]
MWRYVGLRILDAIPTVILALTLVFIALRLLPGDPAQVALGEFATPEQVAALRAKMGLDVPIWQQYFTFLWSTATFSFGTSFSSSVPVRDILLQNLPFTIELTFLATIFGLIMGIPLGVISATRRGTRVDFGSRIFALVGFAIPDFYLGALLLIWLSLEWGLFPISGGGTNIADRLDHLILPALALGFIKAAFLSRLTRGTLLEVLGRDYIRTARAKGAREPRVVYRHGLRNAMLPVSTGLALSILSTLSGSVAIELIFNRPGIGSMLVDAISTRDYPVVQAGLIVFALFVVGVNLVMDLINIVIDPRIKVS